MCNFIIGTAWYLFDLDTENKITYKYILIRRLFFNPLQNIKVLWSYP